MCSLDGRCCLHGRAGVLVERRGEGSVMEGLQLPSGSSYQYVMREGTMGTASNVNGGRLRRRVPHKLHNQLNEVEQPWKHKDD